MKKFLKFIVFASCHVIFWLGTMHANAVEKEVQLNGILINQIGSGSRWFVPTLIFPKTSEDQTNFVEYKDNFFIDVRVDAKSLNEVVNFLEVQDQEWRSCDSAKHFSEVSGFRVRWNFSSGAGELCVTSKDAIIIFSELNRIYASTSNREFILLMSKTIDQLKKMPK